MKRLIFSLIFILPVTVSMAGPDAVLRAAAKQGSPKGVRSALSRGASVNAAARDGSTALHYASARGYTNTARLLIRGGADLNAKRRDGRTPLILAVAGKHADTARLLIDKGADVNARDDLLITALMFASYNGMTETVGLLIDKGAAVDRRNVLGMTALIYTAKYPAGSPELSRSRGDAAKRLIAGGADASIKDSEGSSALSYAGKSGSGDRSSALPDQPEREEPARERSGQDTVPAEKKGGSSRAAEEVSPPCAADPSSKVYALCEVSGAFSTFQNTDLDPLKKKKVERITTGIQKYDTFFDASKRILITMNFAQAVIGSFKAKKSKNQDTSLETAAVVALLAAIPDMIDRVKDLVKSGKELSASVKSDFTGMKALKIPTIASGLVSTIDDLVSFGKAIAKTVEDLKALRSNLQ
jgi:ankyrin repeat protein